MFNVGDRVRYIYKNIGHTGICMELDGFTGTVVAFENNLLEPYYHIEFDEKFTNSHDCSGSVRSGKGYFVHPIFLVPLQNDTSTKIRWYKKGKLGPCIKTEKQMYNDVITDDDFRDFLIDNNAYDEFIEYQNQPFSQLKKENYIEGAFRWAGTKSGEAYWDILNGKWRKQLRKSK